MRTITRAEFNAKHRDYRMTRAELSEDSRKRYPDADGAVMGRDERGTFLEFVRIIEPGRVTKDFDLRNPWEFVVALCRFAPTPLLAEIEAGVATATAALAKFASEHP